MTIARMKLGRTAFGRMSLVRTVMA
jgi:hypothetical protein